MGMAEALLKHPDEIPALVQLKIAAIQASRAIPADPSLGFCYKILMRVSRSFSIVIQQLSPALRDAVSFSDFENVRRKSSREVPFVKGVRTAALLFCS